MECAGCCVGEFVAGVCSVLWGCRECVGVLGVFVVYVFLCLGVLWQYIGGVFVCWLLLLMLCVFVGSLMLCYLVRADYVPRLSGLVPFKRQAAERDTCSASCLLKVRCSY